mmetsp:Transcript_8025/g.22149  ORF Transcript_8025/g.22149 Transcript_8025/m.22149 type:complete len:290 (+) Transcript_8025:477-1346(+)
MGSKNRFVWRLFSTIKVPRRHRHPLWNLFFRLSSGSVFRLGEVLPVLLIFIDLFLINLLNTTSDIIHGFCHPKTFEMRVAHHGWRREALSKQLVEGCDVDLHAIISHIAHVQLGCRRLPTHRIQWVEGSLDEGHAMVFKLRDVLGFGSHTVVGTTSSPETLVHQQRASHNARLFHPERLDRCAQSTVHDERVDVLEEHSEVSLFDLEEPVSLEHLHLGGEVGRNLVGLPLPHVDQSHVESTLLQHFHGIPQQHLSRHEHAAESHKHQLRAIRLSGPHEFAQRSPEGSRR